MKIEEGSNVQPAGKVEGLIKDYRVSQVNAKLQAEWHLCVKLL